MDAVTPVERTLLSLERFRSIVGIQPAAFWQAQGVTYFPNVNACNDIFYQFYWQSEDNVSREEIARAIKDAEDEITRVLHYSPAPVWVEDELQDYPRHYRKNVVEYGMVDSRGFDKAVQLSQAKFLEAGIRTSTLVQANAAVVLTDADGDGYNETATITVATMLTDKCEIHCYFAGESGNPDWEIRSPRSVTLSGGNIIFKFWAWQLLDPELQQRFTVTGQSQPIDVEAAVSYVTVVDVYREYTDFTQVSARFYWQRTRLLNLGLLPVGWCCTSCNGTGCAACEFLTQDGCIKVKDAAGQFVVPTPATYDDENAQWQTQALTVCRDPDLVKVFYRAGDVDQKYLNGQSCEPLSHYWAETIAWLAVARVNRPFCTCNNSLTLLNNLQRDLRFTGSKVSGSYQVSTEEMTNPFGSKLGEVKAWQRVAKMSNIAMVGVAV